MLYSHGVNLTASSDSLIGRVKLPKPEDNLKLIQAAVEVAKKADVIVVAVGEIEVFSMEAGTPDHFGDMSTLQLQSEQEEMVEALVATGKPVIVYLAHGRPLAINWIERHVPAIVDGWFTGEESGNAFAHIIFGDVNPSGKLTISVPRSAGQLPLYYNHKPGAHFFEYVTEKNTPLYPFGYGLSYTTFSYGEPILSNAVMKRGGSVEVSATVSNTGSVAGDEIVQLYIHQQTSSVTRPVKELKGFSRIHLEPGESKEVTFKIDDSKLAFWNKDMKYTVEPGTFQVMIGRNSNEVKVVNLKVQ